MQKLSKYEFLHDKYQNIKVYKTKKLKCKKKKNQHNLIVLGELFVSFLFEKSRRQEVIS